MTSDQWFQIFQIFQALIMAATFIVTYVWGLRRRIDDIRLEKVESAIHDLRDDAEVGLLLQTRVTIIEQRIDRAGKEQSEWAGKTQTLINWYHEERGRRSRKDE